jgi:hypothetical protein
VELCADEIVKYRGFEDMKAKLLGLFQSDFDLSRIEAFLEEHQAERIAERFVQLFEGLRGTRKGKADVCAGS